MAGFRDRGIAPAGHRMVPHPAVTLLLEFGSSAPIVETVTGQQRGSLVAPPAPNAVWVRGENVECVQVRLSPVVAQTVLDISPAELACGMVALDDLWGREVSRICAQLGEAASWADRFALVDALLIRHCAARSFVDPEVARAWDQIVVGRGAVRVDSLAAEVGWTRKRLWSKFQAQLGLPPKQAAKLIRFDHAAHLLAAGADPARVAAETGYADQSHLHRDVMAFTGVTPATVADEPWLAVDDTAWAGCPPRA